jgi:hypothetical protein
LSTPLSLSFDLNISEFSAPERPPALEGDGEMRALSCSPVGKGELHSSNFFNSYYYSQLPNYRKHKEKDYARSDEHSTS